MKIVITGATGLLGPALIYELSKRHEIIGLYNKNPLKSDLCNFIKVDLTKTQELKKELINIKPDIIIHAAALTDVDLCEQNPTLAKITNVLATEIISDYCIRFNILLVYISTDYIFDGTVGDYSETSKPNPINYYGVTKYNSEQIVQKHKKSLILRTSIYGWNITNKKSFTEWVIDSLKSKKLIYVTDQISSMMFTNYFAKIIKILISTEKTGVYNVGSSENISKYDLAVKVAEIFGLDKNYITNINLVDINTKPARRPQNTNLSVKKLEETLDIKLPNCTTNLKYMKHIEKEFKSKFVKC